MNGKKILVLEDDLTWHELLLSVLRNNEIEYDAFVRVYAEGDEYVFMDINGQKHRVDYSNYWLALVDGRLKTSIPQGVDLAGKLPKLGLPVIAISGSVYLNDAMVNAGALTGIAKYEVFDGLFFKTLNLVQIVSNARKAS